MAGGAEHRLLCPSARHDAADAVTIGVVAGTPDDPRVRPLARPLPVTPELLALAEPVRPTEVFRFAAPCLCAGCAHFADARCGLAAKVTRMLPTVTADLPECDIRPHCRWFVQEGRDACLRCPSIVTDDVFRERDVRLAANPSTPVPTKEHLA
jgi:hypothetical protein